MLNKTMYYLYIQNISFEIMNEKINIIINNHKKKIPLNNLQFDKKYEYNIITYINISYLNNYIIQTEKEKKISIIAYLIGNEKFKKVYSDGINKIKIEFISFIFLNNNLINIR